MFIKMHRTLLAAALAGLVLGCRAVPGSLLQSRVASQARVIPAEAGATQYLPNGAILNPPAQLPDAKAGYGYLAMRIHWPRRIQTIPISAEVIHINILDALGVPAAPLTRINRPPSDDVISNVAIPVQAARRLTIWARAYRSASATVADFTKELQPKEVAIAVGSAPDINVFDNVITPVQINMKYMPISVSSITPDNGGEGATVTLSGIGFFGFVDPLYATPSFLVRFTHQTVLEGDSNQYFGPVVNQTASPSAGTDLWRVSLQATRSSDLMVEAVVPDGAVNGPVDYVVDGVSAALPRKTFRVLKQLAIWKNEGPGTGPDHAAFTKVFLEPGDKQFFKARATDSIGLEHLAPAVTWASDNKAAGVIDSSGLFTARLPGAVKVTATTGKLKATVDVVVINPAGTASFQVPLSNQGANTKVDIALPDYDKGILTGIASP